MQPLLDAIPSKEPNQPPTSEIDADEIVAAYERVIGDVHDDVLPSVVSVFVLNRVEISVHFQDSLLLFHLDKGLLQMAARSKNSSTETGRAQDSYGMTRGTS